MVDVKMDDDIMNIESIDIKIDTEDDDGIAYTVLGVWKNFVGDTIKVYCGYYWDYGPQYLDSLKIIVEELNE